MKNYIFRVVKAIFEVDSISLSKTFNWTCSNMFAVDIPISVDLCIYEKFLRYTFTYKYINLSSYQSR